LRRPANVLVVGEAIGATFPLSGEGIGKAMQTGEWAAAAVADALVAGDLSLLSSYEKRVAALRPLYGGYDVAQRWLARPWLNDTIAALVRGSPAVIQQLEGILSETVDPRRVFSLRGVWRMITR
jgi:flavin-dependent dehydrogenase